MNDKHVWVADPGAGKLKYTREEFCRCWLSAKTDGEDTGVALLLEPTPEFYAQEDEGKRQTIKASASSILTCAPTSNWWDNCCWGCCWAA